ncbi:hypothetical protein [Nocardia mexicana]|uniref:Uncharacterized protein n=1 Tax=Nocardia mexicana TaxID=279262 RepID=A0A370H0V8_9NOCA|nr:hypothetical protein [Nocardia mexicana]RDI49382.1 hypothetical protein DFR68_107510 [Nocardia mexicana]
MSKQSTWPEAAPEQRTATDRNRMIVVQVLLALGALAVVAAGCYALVAGALPEDSPSAPTIVPPSPILWTGVVPR